MSIRNYIKKNRRQSSIAYSTICSGATSLNTPQLAAGSFIILSVVNLGVPLVSTALMSLGRGKEIGIILSAITSLSASLLALYNVREKWTMYRTAAEHIKSQYSLYCGEVFPYDGQDGHAKYLTMLETYMAGIHIQWYDMQKEEKKEEKRL